jgi:hypothetical protein
VTEAKSREERFKLSEFSWTRKAGEGLRTWDHRLQGRIPGDNLERWQGCFTTPVKVHGQVGLPASGSKGVSVKGEALTQSVTI